MSTGQSGNIDGASTRTDQGKQRAKRRREDSVGPPRTHNINAPQENERATLLEQTQIPTATRKRRPALIIGERSGYASHPSVEHAAANSELPNSRRHQTNSLESFQNWIDLSRLDSLSHSPQIVPSHHQHINPFSPWPTLDLPRLQYLLGLGRAQEHQNMLAQHSFATANSLYAMLPPLQENAAAELLTRFPPHDASLASSQHLNAIMQSARLQRSLPTLIAASARAENYNDGRTDLRWPPTSSRTTELLSSVARPAASREIRHQTTTSREIRPQQKKRNTDPQSVIGLTLYTPGDDGKLNENQIFLRKQIEIFRATEDDILSITRGKNKPIVLDQVGLRCRHCSHIPVGMRKKGATYFPSTLLGIYQAAQNLNVEHLQSGRCTELPLDLRDRFSTIASGKPPASSAGKRYWAEAGMELGLVDTEDGIRFAVDLRRGYKVTQTTV